MRNTNLSHADLVLAFQWTTKQSMDQNITTWHGSTAFETLHHYKSLLLHVITYHMPYHITCFLHAIWHHLLCLVMSRDVSWCFVPSWDLATGSVCRPELRQPLFAYRHLWWAKASLHIASRRLTPSHLLSSKSNSKARSDRIKSYHVIFLKNTWQYIYIYLSHM